MLRLKEKYQKEIIPAMMEKFGYKNRMAVPRIEKVTVNTGFGRLVAGKSSDEHKKIYNSIVQDLNLICGQKATLNRAKKSIASFKIREGQEIGASCVLRKSRMYDFLDRLTVIALPRSRDFRGISAASIDKQGNLTIGIKEHIAFPEIFSEKAKTIFGLEITVVTTARKKEESMELLKLIGFPFKA
ncbi:MAG: 50S ribosomal protein L5 [Candidatus Wildermuthbacteria bacterium]|nr:50S ribosomal protein L5 [Candidatus Wildermuthbacteria bacterium]